MISPPTLSSQAAGQARAKRRSGWLGWAISGHEAAAFAVLLLGVVLLYAAPVPSYNEAAHLTRLAALTPGNALAHDWTLGVRQPEYLLFDQIFAPLARLTTIEGVGWIGRALTWPLLLGALLAFARSLKSEPLVSVLAIGTWLAAGQSLFAGSWMFGGFEAKLLAHFFFVLAFAAAISRRLKSSVALIGLTLAFHPAVGILGGGALALALLVDREDRPLLLKAAWIGLLFGLPGIVGVFSGTAAPASADDWRFLTRVRMPHHCNPFFFGYGPALTTAAMAAFNVAFWGVRTREGRLLSTFQLIVLVQALIGTAAWLGGFDCLTAFTPFRIFSLWTPLLFLFNLGVAFRRFRAGDFALKTPLGAGGVLALAGLLVFSNPVEHGFRLFRAVVWAWRAPAGNFGDVGRALSWVSTHGPKASMGIVPVEYPMPQVQGLPMIVSWKLIRYDQLTEWRRRVDALLGGKELESYEPRAMRAAFDALTSRQIEDLAKRYDAKYLVASSPYPYRVLHREGMVSVYDLTSR